MKERPILFSGLMVQAILQDRKTQTRRIVNPYPEFMPSGLWAHPELAGEFAESVFGPCLQKLTKKPYAAVGDRLWVRETLRRTEDCWVYAADGSPVELPRDDPNTPAMIAWAHHQERDYCPSIHMPRWASHITLEVTGVKVERVQDISEDDCKAEGVPWHESYPVPAAKYFAMLWDEINRKRAPWESNPWVWVVEFERVHG